MNVHRYMRHPVLTAKPHESIRHARETMEKHRVNQLPVVVDGRLVGIVTDRDLRDAYPSVFESLRPRRRLAASDPDVIPVADVMSQNVLTLGPDASVADAARLMRRERIGALPIVDRGRLVGILTRSDLLGALATLTGNERAPGSGAQCATG